MRRPRCSSGPVPESGPRSEPVASATGTVDLALVRLAGSFVAGLTLFAGLWLAIAPPETAAAPWASVAATALAAAALTTLVIGSNHPPRLAWVIPVAAFVPFAALGWLRLATQLSGFWAVAEVLALATGFSLLAVRRLLAQGILLGVVVLLLLLFTLPGADELNALDNPTAAVLSTARVATLSISAVASGQLLRPVARRIDQQRAQVQSAYLARARQRAQEQARNELRAAIHDTVLNTLEAAAVGSTGRPEAELRSRYQDDLDRLRHGLEQSDQQGDDLNRVIGRWRSVGLDPEVQIAELTSPPPEVSAAVVGAVDELLRNVYQHARTEDVSVSARLSQTSVTVTVLDYGVGFDPSETELGIGLRNSVVQRMKSVGGRAAISSESGAGTKVTLTWEAADLDVEQAVTFPATNLVPALLRGLTGLVGLVAALAAATLIITHASYFNWVWAFVSITASVSVSAWLLYSARRAPLERIHATTAVVVSATSPWSLALAERYCSPGTASALPLDGRLLPLLVLLTLAPRRSWWLAALAATLLSASWLTLAQQVLESPCGPEPLLAWITVLITATGGYLLGRVVASQQAEADLVAADALRLQVANAEATAAQQARAQWQGPALATALADLAGLAEGSLDPSEASTRAQLRTHAGRLRATVVAGQVSGPLGRLLQQIADSCAENGTDLAVQIPANEVLPLPTEDWPAAPSALRWLAAGNTPVRATVAGGSDWGSLLLQRDSAATREQYQEEADSFVLMSWSDGESDYWHAQWSK